MAIQLPDIDLPARDEIHLWYEDLNAPCLQSPTKVQLDLLNAEERKTLGCFKNLEKQREYWVTRILTRSVLARYLPKTSDPLSFSTGIHGRPELLVGNAKSPLCFNISHCKGLLVIAVARNCELGIDVEEIKKKEDEIGVAERFFSAKEFSDLKKCFGTEQVNRFYEYWTLKEAYIKARGKGLSMPLQDFSFDLETSGSIQFAARPSLDNHPENWRFWLQRPTERHQMAMAVRPSEKVDFRVVTHWNLLSEIFQTSFSEEKLTMTRLSSSQTATDEELGNE